MNGHFDHILEGGHVLDGSPDLEPYRADVGIRDGRIAAIGDLRWARGARHDVRNHIVAPGFIDVHSHIERVLVHDGPHRYGPSSMGVTTVLTGADGFGWVGVDGDTLDRVWRSTLFAHGAVAPPEAAALSSPSAYLESFDGRTPINIVPQAPHQAIRAAAVGFGRRDATAEQRRSMTRELERWFASGAVGLGLGMDYAPGLSASEAELKELASVVAQWDGIIASHLRYQEYGRVEAWRELMRLQRTTSARVHVSHEVVDETTRPLLDACDQEDIDLTFESYLYPAGCTHLSMQLPLRLQADGPDQLFVALQNDATRQEVERHLGTVMARAREAGEAIVVIDTPSGGDVGRILTAESGEPESVGRNAISLLERHREYVLCLYHRSWRDEEREAIFDATATHPRMVVASDGVYHGARGHPRGYGTTTQFLRTFANERRLLDLAQAVYRMSGFAAQRFSIPDRGFVRTGAMADLVVFDPVTVRDQATWSRPFAPSTGILATYVHGARVWHEGRSSGALPGRVIHRGAPMANRVPDRG